MVPLPAARETQALGRTFHHVGLAPHCLVQAQWCRTTPTIGAIPFLVHYLTHCNTPKPTTTLAPPHCLVQAQWCRTTPTIGALPHPPLVLYHTSCNTPKSTTLAPPPHCLVQAQWCRTTPTIGAIPHQLVVIHQNPPPCWLYHITW